MENWKKEIRLRTKAPVRERAEARHLPEASPERMRKGKGSLLLAEGAHILMR